MLSFSFRNALIMKKRFPYNVLLTGCFQYNRFAIHHVVENDQMLTDYIQFISQTCLFVISS